MHKNSNILLLTKICCLIQQMAFENRSVVINVILYSNSVCRDKKCPMCIAGILWTQQKLGSHYYLKNKLFCSALKITKISVAVEDLYLIADRIESFKKNSHNDKNDISICCNDFRNECSNEISASAISIKHEIWRQENWFYVFNTLK